MTSRLSSIAAGLLAATAIIGCAAIGALAAGNAGNDRSGSTSSPVLKNISSDRVYCYIGLTGDRADLHRGWVCQQETIPESS